MRGSYVKAPVSLSIFGCANSILPAGCNKDLEPVLYEIFYGTSLLTSVHSGPGPIEPIAAQSGERDAELGQYPPSSSAALLSSRDGSSQPPGPRPTPFPTAAEAESGASAAPAARQAYLAAELRSEHALFERGGMDVDVRATKAKIRALEEQQQKLALEEDWTDERVALDFEGGNLQCWKLRLMDPPGQPLRVIKA
ncbi:hypothetical protein K438DRAFT_1767783 [Mycena galopus ATCC 62051]|nr:hypothetical protein K438DRAFT_1767783 [Mycena galopus ATCC 62051]